MSWIFYSRLFHMAYAILGTAVACLCSSLAVVYMAIHHHQHNVYQLSQALEGKCRVLKLDSDEEEDMAGTLNIYGLPTVIFMKDGEVRHRTEGFLPAEEMLQLADIHLFGKAPPQVTDPADDLFIDDSPAASACAPSDDTPACPPPSTSSSACEP